MIDVMTTRFAGLSDATKIRELVTVRPTAVQGLILMEASEGADALSDALKKIYLPNQFSIDFIKTMMERAARFSRETYDSERTYVSRLYNPEDAEVAPVCLTGLAGVGKSQTILALRKVLPGPIGLSLDHFDGELEVVSHWYASARGKAGGRQLLADFLGEVALGQRPNSAKLLIECRKRASRNGVSLLMLEETQHINTGQGASRVTDILLTMAAIGPPMVYVSNYSLVHKLLRRNSEDKQRLLAEPKVMLPDSPESDAWRDYVRECVRVSEDCFSAPEDDLTVELYRSTFGIKRLAVQLIRIAYLESRAVGHKSVEMSDIFRAYRSTEYSANRTDVEELQRQAIDNRITGSRVDLRCPFELPVSLKSNVISFAKADRDHRVADKIFRSSLNETERAALQHFDPNPSAPMTGSRPVSKRISAPKATKDDLANAFKELLDSTVSLPKPGKPK